eukprot:COSAG02_NODE_26110_length_640_cov_2.097967_2_plen_34_part_01
MPPRRGDHMVTCARLGDATGVTGTWPERLESSED